MLTVLELKGMCLVMVFLLEEAQASIRQNVAGNRGLICVSFSPLSSLPLAFLPLLSSARARLNHDPPSSASCVAGIIDIHYYAWLLVS